MLLRLVGLNLERIYCLFIVEPTEGSLVFAFNHLNRIGGCMQTSLSEHQEARTGSRYVHETLTTTLTHRKTRDSPNTRLRPDGR